MRRKSTRRRSPRRRSPRLRSAKRSHRLPGETKQECVGRKIGMLRHEGYPQRQSIAIAYSMCSR